MNRVATLNQAVVQFESEFLYCKPKKYRSKQGYDYLICANKIKAQGSLHVNNYFDYFSFSYYEGNIGRLSTKTELKIGDIVFYKNFVFAVKTKLLFNETMGLHHYELISSSDFFTNFILTDTEIKGEILGSDSTRYILAMDYEIPIIPARLEPTKSTQKFIAFEIVESKAHSMPSVIIENETTMLSQAKSDLVQFIAINLNTKELQDFIHALTNSKTFGYSGMPSFKQSFDTFRQDFNIKANIHELSININYCINTPHEVKEQTIEEINLNLINLTQGDNNE